ncbi:hypothetical protein EV421DRAFT_295067 [Armillaria borealis]|uniref:Uncharacterized protein n=1 Tax=Armillaria borealis TaxID=47425 RepID=A0AA39JNI5_9AGAR|nr:hypothetical protein EV421DRAFT_295067 [Armillaria borealis]
MQNELFYATSACWLLTTISGALSVYISCVSTSVLTSSVQVPSKSLNQMFLPQHCTKMGKHCGQGLVWASRVYWPTAGAKITTARFNTLNPLLLLESSY